MSCGLRLGRVHVSNAQHDRANSQCNESGRCNGENPNWIAAELQCLEAENPYGNQKNDAKPGIARLVFGSVEQLATCRQHRLVSKDRRYDVEGESE